MKLRPFTGDLTIWRVAWRVSQEPDHCAYFYTKREADELAAVLRREKREPLVYSMRVERAA